MVNRLEDYLFSSYIYYIEDRELKIRHLDTSLILNYFSDKLKDAREKYKQYVMENINMKNPLKGSYKNFALGDKKFIEKVKAKIKKLKDTREISHIKSVLSYSIDDILEAICASFRIKKEEIFKKQKGNIYRQVSIYLIKKSTRAYH